MSQRVESTGFRHGEYVNVFLATAIRATASNLPMGRTVSTGQSKGRCGTKWYMPKTRFLSENLEYHFVPILFFPRQASGQFESGEKHTHSGDWQS